MSGHVQWPTVMTVERLILVRLTLAKHASLAVVLSMNSKLIPPLVVAMVISQEESRQLQVVLQKLLLRN